MRAALARAARGLGLAAGLVLAAEGLAWLAATTSAAGQALAAGAHTPGWIVALVLALLAARLAAWFVSPVLAARALVRLAWAAGAHARGQAVDQNV